MNKFNEGDLWLAFCEEHPGALNDAGKISLFHKVLYEAYSNGFTLGILKMTEVFSQFIEKGDKDDTE